MATSGWATPPWSPDASSAGAEEVMLSMNGLELQASIDDAERVILCVAAGALDRAELLMLLEQNVRKAG